MKHLNLIVLISFGILLLLSLYNFLSKIKQMNGDDEQAIIAAKAKRQTIWLFIAFCTYVGTYYFVLK